VLRVAVRDIQADERDVHSGEDFRRLLEISIADTRADSNVLQDLRVGVGPSTPLLDGVVLVDAGDHLEGSKGLGDLESSHSVPGKKKRNSTQRAFRISRDSSNFSRQHPYMLAAMIGTPVQVKLLCLNVKVLSRLT